jgi:hypothetical protein
MKKRLACLFALAWFPLLPLLAAQEDKAAHSAKSDMGHVMVTPDDVKWGPAPPGLPPGAKLAVLAGDPSKAGVPYTIRARFPDGYKVPPHWHPVDENVTVLRGTLGVGRGEKFDRAAGKELPAGSFSRMPKGMRHFAWAKGETVIQVHGIGPFEIHYVNPADDPREKSKSK